MKRLVIHIILFSIFTSFIAFAQQDTTIGNKSYIIHTVQPRETLFTISRKYDMELNKLVVSNPEVINGLHIGLKLFIPNHYSVEKQKQKNNELSDINSFNKDKNKISLFRNSKLNKTKADSSMVKVALLLPFYLDLNDSLKAYSNNKSIIYPKSKVALDFYFGFQLGIDSLTKLGYNIDLMLIDITNDSIFNSILESNILDDREYIFGPIYIRQFENLAKFYGYDSKKKLISPLSYMSVKNNYRNVYQSVPLSNIQISALIEYIVNTNKSNELIILGHEKEVELISHTKNKLKSKMSKIDYKVLTLNKNQLSDRQLLKSKLKIDVNNIIIPSNDRSFVSRLLPILGSMEDTLFNLYGLYTWNRFDNLDYNDLVSLNVHLPSLFVKDSSQFYKDFLLNFYNKYFSYPENYAYSAYVQCMYFLSNEFKTILNYKRVINTSFKSNTKFDIYKYDNFERIKVQ
tara:strand:+ start:2785 stop:4161 length:1377 start_codon:yes stop_codon:yes gene_type:complete